MSLRTVLVNEVRIRLGDKFLACGFSFTSLQPSEQNRELKTAFPLGRLKRTRGDQLDLVEFQFDKHGKPRFVINFGIAPSQGVLLPWGVHLDQHALDVAALPEAYRLYSSTCFSRWFQSGFFWPKSERSMLRIVDQSVLFANEIFTWFENQTVGRHMRKFGWRA